MSDLSKLSKEKYPDLAAAVPEDILEWLGTLAQVHKSKAVHSNFEDKIYSQAELELERASVFDMVIKFLSSHSIYHLELYSDDQGVDIIPELNNLVFNKFELEDIIFLQPISDDLTAQKLQDIASNLDTLREKGFMDGKTIMIVDSSVRMIRARLGVATEASSTE